ncbi:hypothetical protein [Spirosoma fluminis]
MGLVMKVTPANIHRLWFSTDTPLRQFRIKMNPRLWDACTRVEKGFAPPSGAQRLMDYTRRDKVAFVRLVLKEIDARRKTANPEVVL